MMKIKLVLISILLLFSDQLRAGRPGDGITLNLKNADFAVLIRLIEKQSRYRFIYNSEQVALASKISIRVKDASIKDVLEISFRNQPLQYIIDSTIIIISPKSVEYPTTGQRKGITVEGRVVNDRQESLPGVSIMVKQSEQGTSTDPQGKYTFSNLEPGVKLIFSNIGYQTQEIELKGQQYLDVKLVQVINNLDESIVIGYGNTTRRLNTGSVGKVGAGTIEQQPVNNILAALQGRITGLNIIQNTGVPGGSFTVQIRGRNSIAAGNDPLYIIDGVPVISQPQGSSYSGSSTDFGNPLSNLNPLDIESIEILKDADATAIYGTRGANGVIIISTKKGKPGMLKIAANIRYGAGEVERKVQVLNTPQYLEMRREAFRNDGLIPTNSDAPDLVKWDSTKYTDWQEKILGGHAEQRNAQLSLSGGKESLQFLMSGNYYQENTVFPGNFKYERYNGHFGLSYLSPGRKFNLNFSGIYGFEKIFLPNSTFSSIALQAIPNAPEPFNSDGSLHWENGFSNPYQFYLRSITTRTNNFLNNFKLNYQILPGLTARINAGYNLYVLNEERLIPGNSFNPAFAFLNATASIADKQIESYIVEPQLDYQKVIKKSTFHLLIGSSIQESKRVGKTIAASGFSSDDQLQNLAAASFLRSVESIYAKYRYSSFFSRFSYDYSNRYIVNLTIRRDGSSRFGTDRQFANFGSIGAAWIFTKEKILSKPDAVISFGKLRLSYGTTGNDQIGDYMYLNTWQSVSLPFQGNLGYQPVRLFNPDFRWELTKKSEAAIELGFLHNRILVSCGYYNNNSGNLLVNYTLPAITGFTSIFKNLPAKIKNSGWEFELNTSNIVKNNFSWLSSFNLTIPRTQLLDFPEIEKSPYANIYVIGYPLSVKKNFISEAVDMQDGIYQFKDVDGDGSVSPPADAQKIQFVGQRYYGGLQNSFRYKQWEMEFFFSFVNQSAFSLQTVFEAPGFASNQQAEVMSRWRRAGDITGIQKFTQSGSSAAFNAYNNQVFHGDNITNSSYCKLRNFQVSFLLVHKSPGPQKIDELKIYLQGQNLCTITSFKGLDPETKDPATLPNLRVVTCGVKVSF